mgnify:FL=1|jgi:hypothetical protein|tara:strand:+ start:114 stop:455 length:342 start_codon:yes stop_codon:yes gene_type:complete
MKINFDKYDATCENGVWTWHIRNKDNTKTIAVKVTFKKDTYDVFSYQLATLMATAEVDKMYFEEKENLATKKLQRIREALKINQKIDWVCGMPDHPIEDELQALIDIIDEEEK